MSSPVHKQPKLLKKLWSRLKLMGMGTLYKVITQFFSIALSLIVIRLHSAELWGSYVSYLLVVQLASQLLSWGSGDYLLREFSKYPNQIAETWQTAAASRSIILIPVLITVCLINVPPTGKALLALWIVIDFLYGLFGSTIIYYRKYQWGSLVELTGNFLVLLIPLLVEQLTAYQFIAVFICSFGIKAVMQAMLFRNLLFANWFFRIDWRFLKVSAPFFMVGVVTLLYAKLDIYVVAYLLDDASLGEYQLMMRWMSLGHLLLTFMAMPFIQTFYRLKQASVNVLTLKVFLIGMIASAVHLAALFVVFRYFYHFSFSLNMYCWMFLQMLPFYAYYLKLYEFFKKDKQNSLTFLHLCMGVLNAAVSFYLIPQLGTLGALISSTIIQYLLLLFYFLIEPLYERFTTR